MDGIVVVNKPMGFTSMDCCAIIRRLAGEKKVGHTGTLDPNATGVLPVCVGKATRIIEYMDMGPKTYVAGARLGAVSDSDDIWGNALENPFASELHKVTEEELRSVLESFLGEIEQIPPMYSAIKVDGQRLYKLARKGQEVERKPRKITVYSMKLLDFDPDTQEFSFECECSRGTYIRTICHDIGEKLRVGALMTSLVRTRCSGYDIKEAVDIRDLKEGRAELAPYPLESGITSLKSIEIDASSASLFLNGNPVWCENIPRFEEVSGHFGPIAVYSEGQLLGICEDGKIAKVLK